MENCPKCESNKISVKWVHEDETIYWNEHKEIANLSKFTRNDDYYSTDKVKKEFLLYTCDNCGYKVAETTKDNNE